MLDIGSLMTLTINDETNYRVYQDHTDESRFYAVPVPSMTTLHDGTFQFGLYEYSGTKTGGYCTFSTSLVLSPPDMTQIKKHLDELFPDLQPVLEQVIPFSTLGASLTYASSDGEVAGQVQSTPSAFQNNEALFLINLDQAALTFFKAYFGGDTTGGFCQIAYEFHVSGYLPDMTVRTAFNAANALNYEKKISRTAQSLSQYVQDCWDCIRILSQQYTSEDNHLAIAGHIMGNLVGNMGQPIDEKGFTIEGLLALSGACLVKISQVAPKTNPDVIEAVENWANQLLVKTIQRELEQAEEASQGETPGRLYIFDSIDSFSHSYKPNQPVNWIQKTTNTLSGLPDFNQQYFHPVNTVKKFTLLVSVNMNFTEVIHDIVVSITYPGLENSSFSFNQDIQSHIFSSDWDDDQEGDYTIQYTVTFKDKNPPFVSPSIKQNSTYLSITAPELGVQNIYFDATAIQFGKGETQIDYVDVTVHFTGTGEDRPTKILTLNQDQTSGWVHSTFKVPVQNTYTYTVAYFQNGKTQAVYRTPQISSDQSRQVIFNPLTFGNIDFVGEGFGNSDSQQVLMIQLTIDDNPPIQLNPNKENYSIPCVFGPQEKLVSYSATIITRNGQVKMNRVTRPAIASIPIGVSVPWWFSVSIDPCLIQWTELSMIEVQIRKGSTDDDTGDIFTYMLAPDSGAQYWGFSYQSGDSPQYCWGATYFYKNGENKAIKFHDPQGYSTNLTLPASVG